MMLNRLRTVGGLCCTHHFMAAEHSHKNSYNNTSIHKGSLHAFHSDQKDILKVCSVLFFAS